MFSLSCLFYHVLLLEAALHPCLLMSYLVDYADAHVGFVVPESFGVPGYRCAGLAVGSASTVHCGYPAMRSE
jgi:hypothetical protein